MVLARLSSTALVLLIQAFLWCSVLADSTTGDEDRDDDGGISRHFIYKDAVLSGFYSFDGVAGLPPGDATRDHLEVSPKPPGNYVGLDYVKVFNKSSFINRVLPNWLPLKAMDLHPRLVYDRMEMSDGFDRIKVVPQDFWFRFAFGEADRLMIRIGQFVIPYGANPILAPRHSFLLPVEAMDLGLKWDWGLDIKGPVGKYDWELAATIGSGEAVHTPQLFAESERNSYLLTGRIGSPTYWNFQHGLSFLYGDIPLIMGPRKLTDFAVSRWRIGYDAFYKYGTYLMTGGQVTFGRDGFSGDEMFVEITYGEVADVLCSRAWVDWVVPRHQNLRLSAQAESINRDIDRSDSDDTAITLQASYSLTTAITVMMDFRNELNQSMAGDNDAIYLTLVYYGR